jgi:hypothetical protein
MRTQRKSWPVGPGFTLEEISGTCIFSASAAHYRKASAKMLLKGFDSLSFSLRLSLDRRSPTAIALASAAQKKWLAAVSHVP